MEFTRPQQEVISHKEGPCLVLAVPGAGKTTVLLERVDRLLASGIQAREIATITFSRLQAMDLERRFQKFYGGSPSPTFSTIHAFCYRIIQAFAQMKGARIDLIEGSENWNKYDLLASIYRTCLGRPPREGELDVFFRVDGYLKNALVSYSTFKKETGDSLPHFLKISAQYEAFKRERNLIDFDDMLVRTLEILERESEILKALQDRFTYLQVDEAQDTSRVQLEIIQRICLPRNNLLMVADDDQSIYGFRGASPLYLLHFKETYPQAKIIKMEDNYRSTPNIVAVSSRLIQGNKNRYVKEAQATREGEEKIRVYIKSNLEKELDLVGKKIKEDLALGDGAILFRNNISMVALADRLDRMGVGFRAKGNDGRFFTHPVLKDVLDILHFAMDPTDLDSFQRIYFKLNAYLKKDFLLQIRSMDPMTPILDRLDALDGTQNPFYRDKLDRLRVGFRRIRQSRPKEALEEIRDHLGYGDYMRESNRMRMRTLNTGDRVMESLISIAGPIPSLPDLEKRLFQLRALLQEADRKQEKLTLSTIHGAKGLEYDSVWLIDLMQNEFPSITALALRGRVGSGLMEEERRLFYVGMTRARRRLRLVARREVNGRKVEVSQFIEEVRGRRSP